MTIGKDRKKIIKEIKNKTGQAPDVTYKDFPIGKEIITFVYANSVSDASSINDFILRRLDEEGNELKEKDIFNYVKNYVPNNSSKEITTLEDALYYLFNGFTLVLFDDENKIIVFENKANRNSSIQKSENEKSLKGPTDAFTENYENNTGMIRRRLRSENLWFKECVVGRESKTRVALFYMNGICDEKLVDDIYKKIEKIDIEYVGNANYILDAISNPNRAIFPTNLATERPDLVSQMLLQGRVCLMVENSNEVIILPCTFIDFFKNPDDYYEKGLNVFGSRIVRIIAMILALLTPAIYISLMAYNLEAIPSGLLINFSIQRDGVPFSTVFEILVMSFMFQILRESDMRFPGKGGSSISIVGALVLGQAAVEAGIVSPITIIIVGIASVASLAFSSIELINSIRWWQLILIMLASLFGFIGVMFGCIIMVTVLVSQRSCGKPYLAPFEPFNKKAQEDAILVKKEAKLHPNNIYNKEDEDEKRF